MDYIELFVTSVKKEQGLVKIYGQPDYKTGQVVHKYLTAVADQLEGGSPPAFDKVVVNQTVIARFEGAWYRAKVLASNGQKLTMYFMDYGNVSDVTLADIRIGLHSQLNQIGPLAYPFYLAEVIPTGRDWSKPTMEFINDALVNVLCRCVVITRSRGYCFIRIFKRDSSDPLINDMVQCGMAVLGTPNIDLLPSLDLRQQAPATTRPPMGYPPMMPPNSMGPPSPNFPSSLSPQPPHFPTQRVSPQPRHSFPPPGPPPVQPVLPNHHSSHPSLRSLNQSLPRTLMHPNDVPGIRMNREVNMRHHNRVNHLSVQPLGRGSMTNRASGVNQDRGRIVFRPMRLEEGQWYEVMLSSMDAGPGDFCIQLKSSAKQLEDMMESIKRSVLAPINTNEIESGKACLAMLDHTIYRAVVLKRDNLFVKVYFLDYGFNENLPVDKVFNISDALIKPRILSVRCRLHQWPDVPSQAKALAKSRLDQYNGRLLGCKIVTSESERQGTTFLTKTEVQLFDEAGNDIGAEIQRWMARQSQEAGDTPAPSQVTYTYADLPHRAEVYLSFPGTGPCLFFVQLIDCTTKLESLMEELTQVMRSGPRIIASPTAGMPCAAKYTDGVWYRAKVEEVYRQQSKIQVYFVDYGNIETVNNNAVSSIPGKLVSQLPAQAIRCRLAGICEKLDTVPHAVQESFKDAVSENPLTVNVEKKIENVNYLQVSTTTQPILNVNQEIAKIMRDPRSSKNLSNNKMPEASLSTFPEELYITYFESTNNFYGQLTNKNNQQQVNSFLDLLSDHCHHDSGMLYSGLDSHKGEVCAVPDMAMSGSPRYYRAKIIKELRDSVEVIYFDVGGRGKVAKSLVYTLPQDILRKPEFGIRCSLDHTVPMMDNKMKNLMLNNIVEVKKVRKLGDHTIVEITNNKNGKVKNGQIIKYIAENLDNCRPGQARSVSPYRSQSDERVSDKFNSLLEKQNSRQNQAMEKNGWNTQPDRGGFKRGDLRISLREKRAEREASLPAANPIMTYRYQNIKEGWRGKGKVTWVINPSHFYIQLGNTYRFDDMMSSIQKNFRYYQTNADARPWGKGTPVVAKWENEWFRGKVIIQKGGTVEVFFVDYGNVDKVPFCDVAPLPEEFSELEVQSVRVGLAGLKPLEGGWDKFPTDKLRNYFDEKLNDVDVVRSMGRDILIKINNGSVGQMMIKDGLAKEEGKGDIERGRKVEGWGKAEWKDEVHVKDVMKNEGWRREDGGGKGVGRREESWGKAEKREDSRRPTEGQNKNNSEPLESWNFPWQGDTRESLSDKNKGKPKEDLKVFKVGSFPVVEVTHMVGQDLTGVVSHYNSCGEFWVQFHEWKVNSIATMLESPDIEQTAPSLGLAVVAQWDGAWYRGIVEGIEEEGVKVHFVDYGNTELLKEEILVCGKELLEAPLAAVKCKLHVDRDNFEQLLEGLEYIIKVRIKSFSVGQFVLQLLDRKEKVDKWNGVADIRDKEPKSEVFPSGQNVAVTVVHVEKVHKVWVVPLSVQGELDKLMAQLAECGDGLECLMDVKVGALGATRFSEDGELYRVRLVGVEGGKCEVQYLDYGNKEEVEIQNILVLPDGLVDFSPAARSVKVAATRFALDSEDNRNALLEALSEEDVKIRFDNLMATFSVAGEDLVVKQILKVREGNLFKMAECPRVECSMTYVETGGGVWLSASQSQEKLDDMMDCLQSSAETSKLVTDVKVGDWVAVRFSQDRSFYRAKIIKTLPENRYEVHYIDFGNSETVSKEDIRELGVEFTFHPGYAMRVELDSTGESKVLGQTEILKIVTEQRPLTAELVQPRQAIVRLYLRGERVSYQPGTEALETGLSPARLRLGVERVGIVTQNVNNVMAVQDLKAVAKVEEALEVVKDRLKEVEGVPDVGKVYIQKEGLRRIVFTKIKDDVASACLVDTEEKVELKLPVKLFMCPEKEKVLPQAAMSTAPLVTSTRDRFPLEGRLVGLSVEDNSLKIRENSFKMSVDFSPKAELIMTFSGRFSSRLSLVLPLLPAQGPSWSPEVLATIRDYIMGNKLDIFYNENNVASVAVVGCDDAPLVEKLVDSGVAKANLKMIEDLPSDDLCCMHEGFLGAVETDDMLEEIQQDVAGESNKILIAVNDQLPKLHLTPGLQQVIVLKVEGDSAWIRPESDDLDKTWSDLIDQLSQIAPGGALTTTLTPGTACLYTGEDDTCLRALVVFEREDSVGLVLIDLGDTVLCGKDEVVDLPRQLADFPPMTVLADLKKPKDFLLEDGDAVQGTLAVNNGKLALSIVA